jgi:hypothetical protein
MMRPDVLSSPITALSKADLSLEPKDGYLAADLSVELEYG